MRFRALLLALLIAPFCLCVAYAEEFRIESRLSGATVEIDGKVVGTTPHVSELPGGYFKKPLPSLGQGLSVPYTPASSLPAMSLKMLNSPWVR